MDEERTHNFIPAAGHHLPQLAANAHSYVAVVGSVALQLLLIDEEPAWFPLVMEAHPHQILPALPCLQGKVDGSLKLRRDDSRLLIQCPDVT